MKPPKTGAARNAFMQQGWVLPAPDKSCCFASSVLTEWVCQCFGGCQCACLWLPLLVSASLPQLPRTAYFQSSGWQVIFVTVLCVKTVHIIAEC